MDSHRGDPSHERSIEDYLFSGYRPTPYKPSSDVDQNFAKPIEDEDIFGFDAFPKNRDRNVDTSDETNHVDRTNDINQSEGVDNADDINEADKAIQFREKLREQILAKGLMPKKLGSGCDKDGMIEVNMKLKPSEVPSRGRLIYDKLVHRSDELRKGIYGGRKVTWPIYSEVLRKRICSEKRKVWESFQKPGKTVDYDNEEEMFISDHESEDSEPEDGADEAHQKLDNSDRKEVSEQVDEALTSSDAEEGSRQMYRESDNSDSEDGSKLVDEDEELANSSSGEGSEPANQESADSDLDHELEDF